MWLSAIPQVGFATAFLGAPVVCCLVARRRDLRRVEIRLQNIMQVVLSC
jgi:hypothetical protein